MAEGYSPQEGGGLQKTDMHCHNCSKTFIAELDFDINGNHEIHCPYCQHIHFRIIKDGKITGERYDSDLSRTTAAKNVWTSGVVKKEGEIIKGAKISRASIFLRERWLNKEDLVL